MPLTNTSIQKPSPIEQARERLEGAVARLEESAGAVAGGDGNNVAELAAARAENTRLNEANAEASQRVDAAIDRLRAVLKA